MVDLGLPAVGLMSNALRTLPDYKRQLQLQELEAARDAGVAALVAILAFVAGPLTRSAAAWPLPAKMLLTMLAIAPAAFLMGMPFPSGLRRLEELHPASVRWAWSLNAASSVLGSAGAIFLAIYIGLRATLLVGGALYLVALTVILATRGSAAIASREAS